MDAGLKLSPAWEAEAGWQGALATTGAPNVQEPSRLGLGLGAGFVRIVQITFKVWQQQSSVLFLTALSGRLLGLICW